MARSINNNSSVLKVTFTLKNVAYFRTEEAGKRLFSGLIARAQAEMQLAAKDAAIEGKAGGSAQVDRREPSPASEQDE
jgi:hypothetical protein